MVWYGCGPLLLWVLAVEPSLGSQWRITKRGEWVGGGGVNGGV